jgi:hypothetical protein
MDIVTYVLEGNLSRENAITWYVKIELSAQENELFYAGN